MNSILLNNSSVDYNYKLRIRKQKSGVNSDDLLEELLQSTGEFFSPNHHIWPIDTTVASKTFRTILNIWLETPLLSPWSVFRIHCSLQCPLSPSLVFLCTNHRVRVHVCSAISLLRTSCSLFINIHFQRVIIGFSRYMHLPLSTFPTPDLTNGHCSWTKFGIVLLNLSSSVANFVCCRRRNEYLRNHTLEVH